MERVGFYYMLKASVKCGAGRNHIKGLSQLIREPIKSHRRLRKQRRSTRIAAGV